ncbi:hypothetical protein BACI348_10011 [Bacillus altitudinis]|uniref:Uncharacterized protein n=1 Tax=Bacillus altitudinis TaxID=293387 RepID=A0A653LEA1_BACAB|nr:hypothetical protein BACI348_10011 [Bacillus altitudinis]
MKSYYRAGLVPVLFLILGKFKDMLRFLPADKRNMLSKICYTIF